MRRCWVRALVMLLVMLLVGLFVAARPSSAQRPPSAVLDTAEQRRWREDLDFLAREMPANHANLFHAMSRAQFDSALADIARRLPTLARHEVIVALAQLAAQVGDGHTNVSPWRDTVVAFHTLPVVFYRFAEGYTVRAATAAHRDLLGARVVRVGPVSIDSAEARVATLIARENAMGVLQWAPILLQMPEVLHALGLSAAPDRAELTVEQNGRRRVVQLAAAGTFPNLSGEIDKTWNARPGWVDARDGAPTPHWLSRTGESYWFTYVPEGRLLYCQLNEVQERGEPLAAFLGRALAAADTAGAERFVLDLRLNGGGNGDHSRTIVRALVRSRFDATGRLFVVTSRRTFSAAQMLISDLAKWTHPLFVGEPSASRGNHFGDSRRLVLPNSRVTVRVSTLWWQYWDPRDTRRWLDVPVPAPLTFAAYVAGRDPALEQIVAYRPRP